MRHFYSQCTHIILDNSNVHICLMSYNLDCFFIHPPSHPPNHLAIHLSRGRFLERWAERNIHRDSSIQFRRSPMPNFFATNSCEKVGRQGELAKIVYEKSTPGLCLYCFQIFFFFFRFLSYLPDWEQSISWAEQCCQLELWSACYGADAAPTKLSPIRRRPWVELSSLGCGLPPASTFLQG